jgi:hypothetical protein
MNTFLLTWNPSKWLFQDWPQALADTVQQGFYVCQWSCVSKKPVPGDAVLLKKTGKGLTGLMASGVVVSPPYENRHRGKDKETIRKQWWSQWVAATLAWSLLAGVSKPKVFRGR